ncbi:MAG TPA: TRAP transporter large permease, partial [Gammaproteobacteria bacterium]|nr:TRAP transporter large permease [Gammaproteobacteria bacterium]
GIDPIHFGIIFTVNMELALITPPIGINLYVLSSISKTSIGHVIKGITPFIFIMVGLVLLITYVPAISMWLPNLVFE